jgi:FkbM family methyltransferase
MAVLNNLKEGAAKWFCRHRRAWGCRHIGSLSYLIWRAYENRNFDIHTNGEEWYLSQLSKLGGEIECVFDVGANIGDWALLCGRYFPKAALHAFEIAPRTFEELKRNTSRYPQWILNSAGLSDRNGEIEVFYSEQENSLTTAFKDHLGELFRLPGEEALPSVALQAKVIRGDDYVKDHGIKKIDILKIDVEGMEEFVLRGFEDTLSQQRIRVIQFEYNTTNIISKFLLRDAHLFFAKFGYRLGKLYPNYVDFGKYNYRQEDFCGPNFIAIRDTDTAVSKLLAPPA